MNDAFGRGPAEGDAAYANLSETHHAPTDINTTTNSTHSRQRHNISEQRRRAKLNKILEDLRTLLPESKSTTSSLLDEAIRRIQLLNADIAHVTATNAQLDADIKRLTADAVAPSE